MKIVVISPHPDDETLGAGGFLLKHKAEGDQIYWINVTDARKGDMFSEDFLIKRKEQIKSINTFYGFDKFFNLKFRPATLEDISMNVIISAIAECFREIRPEYVILPNPNDSHTDHKVTYDATMACTKIFRYPYVKNVVTMEILSETNFSRDGRGFSPNLFVDISQYLEKKIEALKIYDTEIGQHPFPRSVEAIRALAIIRGQVAGCKYAEAFKIVKKIE